MRPAVIHDNDVQRITENEDGRSVGTSLGFQPAFPAIGSAVFRVDRELGRIGCRLLCERRVSFRRRVSDPIEGTIRLGR